MKNNKSIRAAYWGTTSFFCLWMLFTAYAQLALPQVRQEFVHLGYPDYFRVELSVAKIIGIFVLMAPVSIRLKEWAYAGFAITLTSALIAHVAAGEGPAVYLWALTAGLFLAMSYLSYQRLSSEGTAPALNSIQQPLAKMG
jgi:surface polysaccharide O-acyltransferase-like enzyme